MSYDFLFFSLFSSLSVVSSLMVISLSNAVHSVLFLIFLFCNVASLLLFFGAEFLSLLFLIVYVGAIAVLFLFVVMMLNVTVTSKVPFKVLPFGLLLTLILFLQLLITVDVNFVDSKTDIVENLKWFSWSSESFSFFNVKTLGVVLYTNFGFLFLLCSLILLVAMIGAIVLTIHQKTQLKKQDLSTQLFRTPKKVIKFSLFK